MMLLAFQLELSSVKPTVSKFEELYLPNSRTTPYSDPVKGPAAYLFSAEKRSF